MVLIFFSFLITSTYAQTESCDPKKLELQCYASVCKNESFVPQSAEGLQEELEGIKFSGELVKELNTFEKAQGNSLVTLEKLGVPEQIKRAAKSILPQELRSLLSSRIKFLNGEFIINPFSEDAGFPEAEAKSFLERYESFGAPLDLIDLAVRNQLPVIEKDKILKLLDELITSTKARGASTTKIETIRQKIVMDQIIQSEEFNTSNILSIGYAYLYESLKVHLFETEKILAWKVSEMKKVDVKKNVQRTSDSCKMMTYLSKKMNGVDYSQNINVLKKGVIEGFQENFLPLLSQTTSSTFKKIVTPSIFAVGKIGSVPTFTYNKNEDIDLLDSIQKLEANSKARCELKGVFDDYYDGNDSIHISPLSMILKSGGMVMAHELGHFIEYNFSKLASPESLTRLKKLMSCLSSFHPSSPGSRVLEDFGDWFAVKIGFKDTEIMCELNAFTQSRGKTKELYSSNENDPHSSYLFRALHMKITAGETINQSCRELMDQSNEKPVKCEL